jgi:hypothetical protein
MVLVDFPACKKPLFTNPHKVLPLVKVALEASVICELMTHRSIYFAELRGSPAGGCQLSQSSSSNAEPEKSVLLCVFPLSTLSPIVEMDPFSSQLRAFITSPGVDLEAASGSPEDYDDRKGYLPDFLGGVSDFQVPLPLLKNTSDLVPVERAPQGKALRATIPELQCDDEPIPSLLLHNGREHRWERPFFPFQASGLEDRPPHTQGGTGGWPGILCSHRF